MLFRTCKWAVAVVVAIAGVSLDARTSEAFGHRWHGSWGSSGGSWGSSGGSWGSSGGSWGSSGGSWGRHHRHWRRHGSSGGSWGSSGGSWGSSGGSSGGYVTYYGGSSGGSWGSSGGSWGSSGGSYGGGVIYQGAPAMPAAPTENETPNTNSDSDVPPTPMPGAVYRNLGGSQVALLNVHVPAEAKILVNGAETTSTGTQRQYISRGLSAGNRYAYEVKAEITRDGKTVTESKSVTLGPGEQATLAFNFDQGHEAPVAAEKKAKTKLTLNVPADAKVFLAGNETTSTGQVREFTTTKLAPGAEWNDYTIRVVANIDGREVVSEKTITLTGGEDRELTIDLGTTQLATR